MSARIQQQVSLGCSRLLQRHRPRGSSVVVQPLIGNRFSVPSGNTQTSSVAGRSEIHTSQLRNVPGNSACTGSGCQRSTPATSRIPRISANVDSATYQINRGRQYSRCSIKAFASLIGATFETVVGMVGLTHFFDHVTHSAFSVGLALRRPRCTRPAPTCSPKMLDNMVSRPTGTEIEWDSCRGDAQRRARELTVRIASNSSRRILFLLTTVYALLRDSEVELGTRASRLH